MTTFITLCIASYLLWTAAYLLYERHERRKRQRESEETLPRKVADAEEILGKSTFSLCHSTPQVPEKTETVKPEGEADTFAAESERYPKVVSADELDALFAEGGLELVEGQDEPMEYRDTDAGEPPIDEDEMLEGHAPKAAGLRFEDMGLAVRVAMDDRTATDEERLRAGRLLPGCKEPRCSTSSPPGMRNGNSASPRSSSCIWRTTAGSGNRSHQPRVSCPVIFPSTTLFNAVYPHKIHIL